jgi:hypothetical protein
LDWPPWVAHVAQGQNANEARARVKQRS